MTARFLIVEIVHRNAPQKSGNQPIRSGLGKPASTPRLPLTFLAALRYDRIDAPCVLDGPINGQSFTAWVEQFLVPTLKPGDVVIMDNLGSHKGHAVRQAIRSVGARLLFLPPYSPDLNPIEQVFAKLKLLLRKAAERSVDATAQRLGAILNAFPPNECAAYLRNSGYA
jgi:transposase